MKISGEGLTLLQKKRLSKVLIVGCTVFLVSRERIGLSGSDSIIYWIDLGEARGKQFSGLNLKEGEMLWIYYAKENFSVISILRHNGEKIEDLPEIGDVEIE